MGYDDSKSALNSASQMAKVGGDDEDEVPKTKPNNRRKKKSFLEIVFGWIIDPITAIINGVVSIVMFVINSIKFVINLPWCFKWYMFHMIGTILYLPIGLIFMFFGLQSVEKKIFGARNKMHDWIVCNTGYSILRYSDEIRNGCYFETKLKRKCPKYGLPGGGLGSMLSELMNGLFSFNYISVVTSIAFILFFSYLFYYFVLPLLKSLYKKMSSLFWIANPIVIMEMASILGMHALFLSPAIIPFILLAVVLLVLFILWVVYAPKILPKSMLKKK